MNVGADVPARRPRACSPRSPGSWPTARSPTPSRAPSSSPARPSSGCATASGSSPSAAEIEAAGRRRSPTRTASFVVPAFTGLGSPWWDPYARGTIVGISRGVTRAHLARAAVEAMAYQTRDVVDAMAAASGVADRRAARRRRRAGDGPAAAAAGRPARRRRSAGPTVQETTALGAAYLAGLAEGVWGSLDDVAALWQLDAHVRARGRPRRWPTSSTASGGAPSSAPAAGPPATDAARADSSAEPTQTPRARSASAGAGSTGGRTGDQAVGDAGQRGELAPLAAAERPRPAPGHQLEPAPARGRPRRGRAARRPSSSEDSRWLAARAGRPPATPPTAPRPSTQRVVGGLEADDGGPVALEVGRPAREHSTSSTPVGTRGVAPSARRWRAPSTCGSCGSPIDARGRPRRRRRRPARSRRPAGRRGSSSGSATTSSSMARPPPRSRISMPTTSPRTAPIRLATWPSAPGRSGSQTRTTYDAPSTADGTDALVDDRA